MIVGLVSTRFAGLDGVSLEAAKIAQVLERAGHSVVWFAGELGSEFDPGTAHPAAHFASEDNANIQRRAFGTSHRPAGLIADIYSHAADLETALSAWIAEFEIEVMVPHNAISLPMQLPLGVAITNLINETGIRAIGHHHDFGWERSRFSPTGVPDILAASFPPVAPSLRHIVINSIAREELARRRGLSSTVLPNVMDFANPPPQGDADRFLGAAGLRHDDTVLLQPTRILPRKGIELTLELAAALGDETIKVVITHPEFDEGGTYWRYLQEAAERLSVDLRLSPADTPEGPTLADAYAAAALVTFPSRLEGFGNALLEAFYYRRPTVVNRYDVYIRDIAPTGVQCIELDGIVTRDQVEAAARWLSGHPSAAEAADLNYAVGEREYSYRVVAERLLPLL